MQKQKNIREYLKRKYENHKLKLDNVNKHLMLNIFLTSKALMTSNENRKLSNNSKYVSLHNANQRFQKSFAALNNNSNKEAEYKKTFIDLLTQYKAINYNVPHLSLEHNLFNPTVLLMNQNEIESYYKYNTSRTKDRTRLLMDRMGRNVNAWKFYRSTGSERMINELRSQSNHNDREYNNEQKDNYLWLDTFSKRESRDIKLGLKKENLSKENKKLLRDIKATTTSINKYDDRQKTPIKKMMIPNIVLTQNDEMMKSTKTIKTISTHYNTTRYSCTSRKRKPKTSWQLEMRGSFKRTKTIVNDINPSSRNINDKNKILHYYSHMKLPHYNDAFPINELNSKEDFIQFFLNLKETDNDKYDFNVIAKLYCNKCLTQQQRREIGKLYSKQNEPKYLLYLIKQFQQITSKYNISSSYPNKGIAKPSIKAEEQLDEYAKQLEKRFEKQYMERELSIE